MIIDLAIVFVLVLFCVRSFRGGLRGELLGAVGWILSILIAISLSDKVGSVISDELPQLSVISSIVAFFAVLFILRLVIGWTAKLFPETSKGTFDIFLKIVSVAAGFIKGAFFTSVFLLLLSQTSLQDRLASQIEGSTFYAPVSSFSKHVVRIVTDKVPNLKAMLDRTKAEPDESAG